MIAVKVNQLLMLQTPTMEVISARLCFAVTLVSMTRDNCKMRHLDTIKDCNLELIVNFAGLKKSVEF